MKVYEVMARILHDIKVQMMFGLCGDGNLFFVNEYAKNKYGKYIAATHEAHAISMALGYSQISGQVGVATVTHGPGLINSLTPLFDGVKLHTPLVLIAGDTAALDNTNSQSIEQYMCSLISGAGFHRLRSPDTIADDLLACFYEAITQRKPVIFNVSVDYQNIKTSYTPRRINWPSMGQFTQDGDDMDIAIGIIASCHKPVVLVGRGAISNDATEAILEFARRIGAPVSTTLRAKDLFKNDDFNLGMFGTLSNPIGSDYISQSDCVISFGAGLNKHTADFGHLIKNKRIIQIIDQPNHRSNYVIPDVTIFGDPGAAAKKMVGWLDVAEVSSAECRTTDLRTAIQSQRIPNVVPGDRSADTVDYLQAIDLLNETIPKNRILVTDTGRYTVAVWQRFHVEHPKRFVHTTGFAAIGTGLGNAIGAALADGSASPIVFFVGDGGFYLSGVSELNIITKMKLPIYIVICNDGGYGAEYIQYVEQGLNPNIALFNWPSAEKIATAFGMTAFTVANESDMVNMKKNIVNNNEQLPMLFDLQLDPNHIPSVPH